MNSISDSEVAVLIRDLHLVFNLSMRDDSSIRGQFIKLLKNPLSYVSQKPEVLHVLKGINFQAHRGDRIALVGKNGAGKSTLCRLLTRIYQPTKGSISLRGTVRSILDPSAIVHPDLSGRENAKLLMQLMYPQLQSDFDQTFEEALQFSGLGSFLNAPFRHYSNGMQTRLCLSIATCLPSDIFILDEVFDGADADFRERVSLRMLNLIEKSGVVFFVSHSEEQTRKVCNKGILLHNGVVQYIGDLDEVYRQYKSIESGGLGHQS